MKQRHREFRRKWCVADEIRWEGGGMVQKREAFTKQRRTSKRNRRKKNPLQYRVKTDTGGGGKRFFANAQNDRLVERRALRMTAES